MIISSHVRYTVKAEYADQNKERISHVIQEIRDLDRSDIQYSVFTEGDGKTFNHWSLFVTQEARNIFVSLESFKAYQAALHASHLEAMPIVTNLTLVDSTSNLS